MIVLFIGRFQPFHKGHLEVIKLYASKAEKILIGVGSAQYHHTLDNPFTYEERREMIRKSLEAEGIENFEIYPINDIHDYRRWVDHVTSSLPKFDLVIARNPTTLKLFENKGYKVEKLPLLGGRECRGSVIRKRMAEGEEWKHLVPAEVARYIEEINGLSRIRHFYDSLLN